MRTWRVLLSCLSKAVLIMSSIAASKRDASRAFADGILRPFWFIVVDQVPILLLITIGYLLALSRISLPKRIGLMA